MKMVLMSEEMWVLLLIPILNPMETELQIEIGKFGEIDKTLHTLQLRWPLSLNSKRTLATPIMQRKHGMTWLKDLRRNHYLQESITEDNYIL